MIIAPGAPATPTDPFRVYVVGTLDPDDISSFEVTFAADRNVTEVPIVVEYRDDDGNRYTSTTMIGLGSGAGVSVASAAPAENSSGEFPIVGAIVAVLVALGVAGAIYYSWRRA